MHVSGRLAAVGVCAMLWLACGSQKDSGVADSHDQGAAGASAAAVVGTGGDAGHGGGGGSRDAPRAGTAIAILQPFGDGTVTGTATFLQNDKEVSVVVALNNCPDGAHGVHIHQGTICADVDAQGGHWDMTRGEGIPDVMCSEGRGTSMTMRAMDDPRAWTIGGPAETNLVGHVFVVHDSTAPKTRVGCGPITVR